MSEWISVGARLPKDFESVLMFSGKLNAYGVGYFLMREDGLFVSYQGTGAHVKTLNRGITHWMPLPEPP